MYLQYLKEKEQQKADKKVPNVPSKELLIHQEFFQRDIFQEDLNVLAKGESPSSGYQEGAPAHTNIIGNVLIHPTAKVHPDALIGPNVTIGEKCVV